MYVQVPRVRFQIPRSTRLSSVQGCFGVTRIATEKSDFLHSALDHLQWRITLVAVLVIMSGTRRFTSPSRAEHAYGLSHSESSRDDVIVPSVALPNILSFDDVQSTVATEFKDKIRTVSERVGCHTLFFNVFMKFSRDNPAAYHDTNWSMNMSRSDYLSSRMERCRAKYSRRNCKMFAVLVLYVRIL